MSTTPEYDEAKELRNILSDITEQLGRQQSLSSEIRKSFTGLRDVAKEIQYSEGEITDLSDKQLNNLQKKAAKNLADLKEARERLNQQLIDDPDKIYSLTDEEIALQAAGSDDLEHEGRVLEAINNQVEARHLLNSAANKYQNIATVISKIPFGSLVAGPFKAGADNAKKMALAAQKAAKESGGVANSQKLAGAAFKGFAGSVAKSAMKGGAFGLLAFAINSIVEAFINADKQSVELSRSLGVNASQSELLRDNMAAIANSSDTTAKANSENI